MKIFLFFSEILGVHVVDKYNQRVGILCDIAMKINGEVYPRASNLIVKKGFLKKEFAKLPWDAIETIGKNIRLKIDSNQIEYQDSRFKNELMLCVDILDQQIVDTDHQKVVRVNDIHLLKVDNQLYLAHVDVGTRGLARRLAWTPIVDSILKTFSSKSPYLTQEEFISWKNTQLLTLGRTKSLLRLDVARQKLSKIPPTELAEIMEDLDIFERYSLFKSLDVLVQRKVFADLSTAEQEELIDQFDDQEAVNILENIPSDEAVDLLFKLPKEKTRQLMRLMETNTSKKFRRLLGFSQDSAGGLMTTEYLWLKKDATVKDAFQKMKDNVHFPGSLVHIFIVDDQHRLMGTTSLRRILNAEPQTPILETCHPKKIFVRTDDGMEEIALLLEKYKMSAIAVVDEKDVVQGVITIDDVMEELISIAWSKYKERL